MERVQVSWEKKGVVLCGTFLAWGVDYEALGGNQFGGYTGHFSAAIVELPSGSVALVPATSITFIKDAPTTGNGRITGGPIAEYSLCEMHKEGTICSRPGRRCRCGQNACTIETFAQ